MARKVFIIHGWTYTLNKWKSLEKELKKRDVEPVFLKVPGLTEPSSKEWTMSDYVEWLREHIKDEKRPRVVGHSNGGRIAMAYDATYQNHIGKAYLIATAGVSHVVPGGGVKQKVAKLLKPFVRGKLRQVLYRLVGAGDYGNAKPNMRRTMQNMISHSEQFDLHSVSFPAVLIWGKEDHATPVSDVKQLQSSLQNVSQTVLFEGVGHSPHADKPVEIATLISKETA